MGNGNRAIQKRERNAKDGKKGDPKSQLKVNEQAKNVICMTCKATFLQTIREPALREHASNKHNKPVQECFPHIAAAAA